MTTPTTVQTTPDMTTQEEPTMANTAYYMLTADPVAVGDIVADYDTVDVHADGEPLCVTAVPRHLVLSDLEERYSLRFSSLEEIVLGDGESPKLQLATLAPRGPVVPHPDGFPGVLHCEQEWTITALGPVAPVLGPQAPELAVAAAVDTDGDEYVDAVNDQYDHREDAMKAAADAARGALDAHGADGRWLAEAGGCQARGELLALIARDLIGTTPEWNRAAYDELASPYRQAFGQLLHPDDDRSYATLPAAMAGRDQLPGGGRG